MTLHISQGALFLLALIYLPVIAWLLWALWRKIPSSRAIKSVLTVVAFVIAAAIPLGDVLITSFKMAELCPQAGVFIKRSVHTDGFFTDFVGEDALRRGFRYIERRDYGGRVTVYTRDGNTIRREEFDAKLYRPRSRYEYIFKDVYAQPLDGFLIDMNRSVARDRTSAEELGYSLGYTAFPGWFDRNTIGRFGRLQWSCPVRGDEGIDLLYRVFLPN